MQRKRILFVCLSFDVGGIASSMINVANALCDFYDVFIFPYNNSGLLKKRLDERITLIESNWRIRTLGSRIVDCKKLGLKYLLFKIFAYFWSKIFTNDWPINIAIKHQNHLGNYDVACAFNHEIDDRLCYGGFIRLIEKRVTSNQKLSWVHCDYNFLRESKLNVKYFNLCDGVIGVTKSVAKSFKQKNKHVLCKIDYCYNYINEKDIIQKSVLSQDVTYPENAIVCFTAARFAKVKAIPRAIKCFAETLKQKNVFWYIAGDGPEKEHIISTIRKYNLEEKVILIGSQINPYNYLKNADLYLSVSTEEAAPLVYLESKFLGVPVFSTKTLSSIELLDTNVDYICENNDESLKNGFFLVVSNYDELKKRKERLIKSNYRFNDLSIKKFKEFVRASDEKNLKIS